MPWWLTLIIVIETLPMFLGPLGALNNPAFLGGPEATTAGFAAWLYAARNFAVGHLELAVNAATRVTRLHRCLCVHGPA